MVRLEVLLVGVQLVLNQTFHPPSGAPAQMDVLVDSMPLGIVVLVIHALPQSPCTWLQVVIGRGLTAVKFFMRLRLQKFVSPVSPQPLVRVMTTV